MSNFSVYFVFLDAKKVQGLKMMEAWSTTHWIMWAWCISQGVVWQFTWEGAVTATFSGSCNLLVWSSCHGIYTGESHVLCVPYGLFSHGNWHSYPDRTPKGTHSHPGLFCQWLMAAVSTPVRGAPSTPAQPGDRALGGGRQAEEHQGVKEGDWLV